LNNLQVAKVAYEADRALAETLGIVDRPPFDSLSQTDKDQVVKQVDDGVEGRKRGITPTLAARFTAGDKRNKQRAHLFAAVVHALAQHEEDQTRPQPPVQPIPTTNPQLAQGAVGTVPSGLQQGNAVQPTTEPAARPIPETEEDAGEPGPTGVEPDRSQEEDKQGEEPATNPELEPENKP